VRDDIIGISLKWHLRIVGRQPPIQRIMQKQIGQ